MTLDIRALEEAGKAVEESHKTLQSLLEQRTQIYVNQRECEIVLDEFEFLGDDDVVMKQVGPSLIREELDQAKQNVKQRIEFMTNQLKDLDAKIQATQKIVQAAETKLAQMNTRLQQ